MKYYSDKAIQEKERQERQEQAKLNSEKKQFKAHLSSQEAGLGHLNRAKSE